MVAVIWSVESVVSMLWTVLNVESVAAVEAGNAPAVVGEFTTAVAGDRVRYIPFLSKASFMYVGLLYRRGETAENVKKLIESSLAFKEASRYWGDCS